MDTIDSLKEELASYKKIAADGAKEWQRIFNELKSATRLRDATESSIKRLIAENSHCHSVIDSLKDELDALKKP